MENLMLEGYIYNYIEPYWAHWEYYIDWKDDYGDHAINHDINYYIYNNVKMEDNKSIKKFRITIEEID